MLMKFAARILFGLGFSAVAMTCALADEGRVISSIDTAGYTYVEVNQAGTTVWLAVNQTQVKPGQRIQFDEGALMTDFHSSTLERTFPTMRFVDKLVVLADQ
ncbi:hypothetical protein GALL_521540 [mine drainage metagenome]|uniref:NrfJ n=1 Tax=mine drainage metagenome TaxID=410659 RepID=A0A1J5P517_9ZZZZ